MRDLLTDLSVQIVAGLTILVLAAAAVALRTRLAAGWRRLRDAHAARMRRKYPCERPHADEVVFVHPARFELQVRTVGRNEATHSQLVLVNVGQGVARGVTVSTETPWNGAELRGGLPFSWAELAPGVAKPIALKARIEAKIGSMHVDVTWSDEAGEPREQEVEVSDSAKSLVETDWS
jgi:hypothetical protein